MSCPECHIVPYPCVICSMLRCHCLMPVGVYLHWDEAGPVGERRGMKVQEIPLPLWAKEAEKRRV